MSSANGRGLEIQGIHVLSVGSGDVDERREDGGELIDLSREGK